MTDWKDVPRYPVHRTRREHLQHMRWADGIVMAAVAMSAVAIGAYWVGYHQATREISPSPASTASRATPGRCAPSTTSQDVLEHTWSHRGEVFHRECIVVERPNYVAPKYSAAPARSL